jgi:hypothetical protein
VVTLHCIDIKRWTESVEGKQKAQIARELRVDRDTVTRILNESDIREAVEASRRRVLELLPKAERAVETQLDEGDGDLGLRRLFRWILALAFSRPNTLSTFNR